MNDRPHEQDAGHLIADIQAEFRSSLLSVGDVRIRPRLRALVSVLALLAAVPAGALAVDQLRSEDSKSPFVPAEESDPNSPGSVNPCLDGEPPVFEPDRNDEPGARSRKELRSSQPSQGEDCTRHER